MRLCFGCGGLGGVGESGWLGPGSGVVLCLCCESGLSVLMACPGIISRQIPMVRSAPSV